MNPIISRILVVVAHPDDEVIGCGGTLARLLQENKDIFVFILGNGSFRYSLNNIEINKLKKEDAIRKEQCQDSMKILGVKNYKIGTFVAGKFNQEPIVDVGKRIEEIINEFQPDTIFTHSNIDINTDHLITHQAVIQATRPNVLNKIENVLSFELPSSTEWRFTNTFSPNVFINIEQTINIKIRAMNAYYTEIREYPFPRSDLGIRTLAGYRGMQSGLNYAEAFCLIRGILI